MRRKGRRSRLIRIAHDETTKEERNAINNLRDRCADLHSAILKTKADRYRMKASLIDAQICIEAIYTNVGNRVKAKLKANGDGCETVKSMRGRATK